MTGPATPVQMLSQNSAKKNLSAAPYPSRICPVPVASGVARWTAQQKAADEGGPLL